MNKKILETRLRSIDHYLKEEGLHTAAAKKCGETRHEIVSSLNEFFPFKSGDIIYNGDTFFKIKNLEKVDYDYSGFICFYVNGFYPYGGGSKGFDETQMKCEWIRIGNIDSYKLLVEAEETEPAK